MKMWKKIYSRRGLEKVIWVTVDLAILSLLFSCIRVAVEGSGYEESNILS